MKVLVSGSGGLIGRSLSTRLRERGDSVTALTRKSGGANEIERDLSVPIRDRQPFENFDAVVHLAGESIMGRWTEEKRERIRDSRVHGTTHLAAALARLSSPPQVLVCASAIGWYGDRGDEILTEDSPTGTGFLAGVSREWEDSCKGTAEAGIRVVNTRFGIVLSEEGGALKSMLPAFRLGVGGRLGSGKQWWSWIALEDAVGAIVYAIDTQAVRGPVNVTAPEPARNEEFTRLLARQLHRPAFFVVPTFALHLALGRQAADELLLASARVIPDRLIAAGFDFQQKTLTEALGSILGE